MPEYLSSSVITGFNVCIVTFKGRTLQAVYSNFVKLPITLFPGYLTTKGWLLFCNGGHPVN